MVEKSILNLGSKNFGVFLELEETFDKMDIRLTERGNDSVNLKGICAKANECSSVLDRDIFYGGCVKKENMVGYSCWRYNGGDRE